MKPNEAPFIKRSNPNEYLMNTEYWEKERTDAILSISRLSICYPDSTGFLSVPRVVEELTQTARFFPKHSENKIVSLLIARILLEPIRLE